MSREPRIVFFDRFLIAKCFGRSPESKRSTQESCDDHKTPESPLEYEHTGNEEENREEGRYEFTKYFEENIENIIRSSHEFLTKFSRVRIGMESDRERECM